MTAEITVSNLYYNNSLMNFFFRNQAKETFEELIEAVNESNEVIFENIESCYDDLDEVEELFYNESIEDLAEIFNLTIQ